MTGNEIYDQPNFDYLNEVTGNSTEIIEQIVSLFLQEAPKDIEALVELSNKGNWEAAGKQAHKLKSSVANFGLLGLKELFFKIEQAGKQQTDTEIIPQRVNEASVRLKKVLVQLNQRFNL